MLTEVPRAIRRSAAQDPRLTLDITMARAGETLDAIWPLPLDRALLSRPEHSQSLHPAHLTRSMSHQPSTSRGSTVS